LRSEERWQRHQWRTGQLLAAGRAATCRRSQRCREIGWGRPDSIDGLKLFEPEVKDVLRCFQDANIRQSTTKLEKRSAQDRHRQCHREVRVLAQR
jgi:hypothetical protein